MFEELIEHVVAEMRKDLVRYCENAQVTERKKRGRIGEFFIGQSMKLILLEYGLSYRPGGNHCCFWFKPEYGKGDGHEGVDFKLDIRDATGQHHTFLIESKNYRDDYNISERTFREEIYTRFKPYDDPHRWHWMVTLNHNHIDDIGWLCYVYGIDIIPLDVVFTARPTIEELTPAVRAFTTQFIDLVQNYVDFRACIRPNPLKISHFVERGVPDRLIISYLGIPENYLEKIKSVMRKKGVPVVYKRSEDGKDTRYM